MKSMPLRTMDRAVLVPKSEEDITKETGKHPIGLLAPKKSTANTHEKKAQSYTKPSSSFGYPTYNRNETKY